MHRLTNQTAALLAGVPVIAEFFATGFVAKVPSAILAVGLMACAALSITAGAILDTVAKSNRKTWELEVYRLFEK